MEAAYVFTRLCMGEFVEETNYLLVAPKCMKSKILNYMDKEIEIARAGGKAYVGAKINSLTDKEIIDKLIECSRAGVRVERSVYNFDVFSLNCLFQSVLHILSVLLHGML